MVLIKSTFRYIAVLMQLPNTHPSSCSAAFVLAILSSMNLACNHQDSHATSLYESTTVKTTSTVLWSPPDTVTLPHNAWGDQVRYGRSLIVNTSEYLGPSGSVGHSANGMNCQNCHLDAGTKPWTNNYSAVFATYPKYMLRSGKISSIERRVNDCFERSLNGDTLSTESTEMKAIVSYIKWLGTNVDKNNLPYGVGLKDLSLLKRAASPANGKVIYEQLCARCHNRNGNGLVNANGSYKYPALWGDHSYNIGASFFRLSRFAAFIKYNMPFDAVPNTAPLSNEDAWDIAAYVNSMPRPTKTFANDYADVVTKPFDYPFPSYTDSFTSQQHKYGPYNNILAQAKK